MQREAAPPAESAAAYQDFPNLRLREAQLNRRNLRQAVTEPRHVTGAASAREAVASTGNWVVPRNRILTFRPCNYAGRKRFLFLLERR